MVTIAVNVAKVILAVGVATGIIILASKADPEGAKAVLEKAASAAGRIPGEHPAVPA